jgi:hypothetical protein
MRINAADINVINSENLKTTGSTLLPFFLRRLKNSISCSEKRSIRPSTKKHDKKGATALTEISVELNFSGW